MIIVFIIFPLFNGTRIALYQWNGYGKNMKYVGLDNFRLLFKDNRLSRTTINTLIYGFGSCFLQNLLGLLSALLVDMKFRGRNSIRAIIYMPIMISAFVMGMIVRYMFLYDNGVLNDILAFFGVAPINWFETGWRGVIIITLVNSWQYVGGCMLIYLAGLQGISSSYIEAAALDGASPAQSFFRIKLPMLIPAITTAVVTNLIGGLKLYEVVVSLTQGGPNRESASLSQYIQLLYFDDERAGYAAAVGVFMFALIFVIAMPVNKYLKSREVET